MSNTFLDLPFSSKSLPARDEEIDQVEELFRFTLPPSLREIWSTHAALQIDECELWSPNAIQELRKYLYLYATDVFEIGLVPIFSLSNSWGTYCVSAREPLSPRVVFVSGKGMANKTTFEDFDQLTHWISTSFAKHERLEDMHHEEDSFYETTIVRNPADTLCAERLIEESDEEQLFFAIHLLDDSNPSLWRQLLESSEHTVDTIERLERIGTPKAQEILQRWNETERN